MLERAILARHGLTLIGPQARTLVADIPRELILSALVESIRWHADGQAPGGEAVLSACRALRYVAEGRWSSKTEAARWALAHPVDRELIAEALRAHETGESLDVPRTTAFLEHTADVALCQSRSGGGGI